jgi:hypothetical protein
MSEAVLSPVRLRGFELVDRLGELILGLFSPASSPKEGFGRILDEATRLRIELDAATEELRRDVLGCSSEYALNAEERERHLRLATKIERLADTLETAMFPEAGPVWSMGRAPMAAFNDSSRSFIRISREASAHLRRLVADELRDDADALAVFDATDPDEPTVEPRLDS